jgi:hypothetical protein
MWGREFDDPWSVSSRAHRAITWVILQHTGSDEHRQVKRMSHMRPDVLFHVANQIAASIAAAMAPGLYDGDRARQRAGCVAALRLLPGALTSRFEGHGVLAVAVEAEDAALAARLYLLGARAFECYYRDREASFAGCYPERPRHAHSGPSVNSGRAMSVASAAASGAGSRYLRRTVCSCQKSAMGRVIATWRRSFSHDRLAS